METLQEPAATQNDVTGGTSFTAVDASKPEPTQLLPAISQRNTWPAVEWLPIQMDVALPVARFCVRDLLALAAGQIIATEWSSGEDLPLAIEDVQLAWVEMEAVEQAMAIRITRLL
ncbi:MAG TPA: FliM/FliN family flagellar motor C-terminal domain-containing protein [Acidobacteriaceae bacterium]|nr:FliM/FliN family flagellar motor C-terminal domain-containing protein [Acidobacteriaceae bacterium]